MAEKSPPPPAGSQRERILDTSLALFRQRGIKAVTMDEIARTLAVSKRTLYQMFHDKETLLVEAMRRARELEVEKLSHIAASASNVLETIIASMEWRMKDLETVNLAFFRDVVKYSRLIRYIDDCEHADLDKAVAFLQRGVEQGLFRDDVDLALFYRLLVVQVRQIVGYHVQEGHDLRHAFLHTVPVSLRGLATPGGQRLVDAFVERYRRPAPSAPPAGE